MKNRLFVFGDSWANNYFSPINENGQNGITFLGSEDVKKYASYYNYFGHWIDHLSNYYDITSFAEGGCSNEQIIYQLSNLPNYNDGDRIIIIITTTERYTWHHGETVYSFVSSGNIMSKLYQNKEYLKLLDEQFVERHNTWSSHKYTNEKRFIDSLGNLYEKWNPIIVTWCEPVYKSLKNVELIDITPKFTNIYEESNNQLNDFHLGISGNYELFKYFAKKLNLNISDYTFEYNQYPKKLL